MLPPRPPWKRPPIRQATASIPFPEQYLILLTCRDERHQVELLKRFTAEGLDCRALVA